MLRTPETPIFDLLSMGKAKQEQQTQDILALIEQHHQEIEGLFEEIENTRNSQQIRKLFLDVYKKLSLHAHLEELVFSGSKLVCVL